MAPEKLREELARLAGRRRRRRKSDKMPSENRQSNAKA